MTLEMLLEPKDVARFEKHIREVCGSQGEYIGSTDLWVIEGHSHGSPTETREKRHVFRLMDYPKGQYCEIDESDKGELVFRTSETLAWSNEESAQ